MNLVATVSNATRRRVAPASAPSDQFPLSIHASGRYLVDAHGSPFIVHGDTPWMLPNQLTNAEIDTYLADRAAKGFNALMIEAPGFAFTSQTPDTNNVDGVAPFTVMSPYNWVLNTAFWDRVYYFCSQAKAAGIVVFLEPAYLGFNGGSEGCMAQVTAASAGTLQAYGAAGANLLSPLGNIVWGMGGDYAGTATERNKQWNIATGILSVDANAIIFGHCAPGDSAYTAWSGFADYTLNSAYPRSNDVYSYCATEYARTGPLPFFMIEAWYEGEPDPPESAARIRLQKYQALLSGACGDFYGNNPVWHFESPNTLYPFTGTWESNLNSTGAQDMARAIAFFNSYNTHLLVPKTDTSLVSSALGSGNSRVCPALASDGSFAMVWIPTSQSVTVVMSALTPSSVRARLFNPTTGAYTTVSGSPFANTGTQVIASGGERVLVLDQG